MSAATLRVRVAAKQSEALDICSFDLESTDGEPLPAFTAGAHIDVHTGDGITRQYSLCNAPADPCNTRIYRIGVLRDAASRGGSRSMHERVQVGDMLEISAPKNHFALVQHARRSLLLAGGIGITPILCMAQQLSADGADFELHYCARSLNRMAFAAQIRSSSFSAGAHLHLDDGSDVQRLDLAALLGAPDSATHLYVCGPSGFMRAVLDCALHAGWPQDRLHYEFFAAEVPRLESDSSFEVALASTGLVVTVGSHQTVVQALAAAGIEIPVSCEQGVCGTCLTGVVQGTPDHRDMYLTPEEHARNDQFTPCCSRSHSPRLVLDL